VCYIGILLLFLYIFRLLCCLFIVDLLDSEEEVLGADFHFDLGSAGYAGGCKAVCWSAISTWSTPQDSGECREISGSQ
jgi:hypothetical protein